MFSTNQLFHCFIIFSILNTQLTQSQDNNVHDIQNYKEQVKKRQYANRDSNQMNYQNIESYTIKLYGVDSYILKPHLDQNVKFQTYVYWKQANIFISSEYRTGEEVRVLVIEDDARIIFDRSFYMVDGFSFDVKKQSTYEIKFISSGRIKKLLSLTLNKMLQPTKKLTETSDLLEKEQKISKIKNQIQAFFSISERNFIMEQRLTKQILSSTNIYMGYQILEIILVLIITVMQTVFVTKLLSSSSIV